MRTIIAGSRNLPAAFGWEQFWQLMEAARQVLPQPITSILSGTAAGIDQMGENWAACRSIPISRWPADWRTFGRAAGPRRNQQMAENADALIAFWDGQSPGTKNMIDHARAKGLYVVEIRVVPPTAAGKESPA
jgi:hypothetical protein